MLNLAAAKSICAGPDLLTLVVSKVMKAALEGSWSRPAEAQATCRGMQTFSRHLISRHYRSSKPEQLQQFVQNKHSAQTKAAAKLSGIVAVSAVAEPPAAAQTHEEFPRGAHWQVHCSPLHRMHLWPPISVPLRQDVEARPHCRASAHPACCRCTNLAGPAWPQPSASWRQHS